MASARPAECTCGHSFSAHTEGRSKGCSFCGCQAFEDAILAKLGPQVLAAVELLTKQPALKDVHADQLIALAESGQRRLYLEGKVLMAQDAPNHSLHILVNGRVRVDRIVNGDNKLLARLGPGDLVGDMGCSVARRGSQLSPPSTTWRRLSSAPRSSSASSSSIRRCCWE